VEKIMSEYFTVVADGKSFRFKKPRQGRVSQFVAVKMFDYVGDYPYSKKFTIFEKGKKPKSLWYMYAFQNEVLVSEKDHSTSLSILQNMLAESFSLGPGTFYFEHKIHGKLEIVAAYNEALSYLKPDHKHYKVAIYSKYNIFHADTGKYIGTRRPFCYEKNWYV
jgi:hypothetical protein